MPKKTLEGYIEVIYELENEKGIGRTSDIARVLAVKGASVTQMLQKLKEKKYVRYTAYKGAYLTEKGNIHAKQLIKKHTVLAEFFMMLGIDKKTANDDASEIEHHVSNETIRCLKFFVNFTKNNPSIMTDFWEYIKYK